MSGSIYLPTGKGFHVCITVRADDGAIIPQNGELPAGNNISKLAHQILEKMVQHLEAGGNITNYAVQYNLKKHQTRYLKVSGVASETFRSNYNENSFKNIDDLEENKLPKIEKEKIKVDSQTIAELVLPEIRVSEGVSKREKPADSYTTYIPGSTLAPFKTEFPSLFQKPPQPSPSSTPTKGGAVKAQSTQSETLPSTSQAAASSSGSTPISRTDEIVIPLTSSDSSKPKLKTASPQKESAPLFTKFEDKVKNELIRHLNDAKIKPPPLWDNVEDQETYVNQLIGVAVAKMPPPAKVPNVVADQYKTYLELQLKKYLDLKFDHYNVNQNHRSQIISILDCKLK